MTAFDKNRHDRIFDGTADSTELSDADEQTAKLLDELRSLRAPEDPVAEAATVAAMSAAVEANERIVAARRGRLKPAAARVAIAVGAVALVGTASAAVEGSPVSIPGVPAAVPAGGVAKSVLASLGISQRTDEEDAAADQADGEKDKAERAAEGAGPLESGAGAAADLPEPAKQGVAKANKNRQDALKFANSMRAWAACVAQKAPQHEASGATGDFDPIAACGAKPTDKGGLGGDDPPETEDEDSGRRGPPATVGPPAGAGPPTGVGRPSGSSSASSSGSSKKPGPPATAGPPESAGPPAGVPRGGDDEDEPEG